MCIQKDKSLCRHTVCVSVHVRKAGCSCGIIFFFTPSIGSFGKLPE